MSIKLSTLKLWKAVKNLRVALEGISPASGDNTRPTVLHRQLDSQTVPTASYPALFLELIGFVDESSKFGSGNSFTEDGEVAFVLWGYVKEPGDMQAAMIALMIDVLEAIWTDESRGDNAILTNIGNIEFDESLLGADNVGVIAIPINLRVQIGRGAS